jgi:uncharacterized membrane protein
MKQLSKLFSFRLAIGLTLMGIILLLNNYSVLPDEMAMHFNAKGEADGFGNKGFVISLMIAVIVFIFGLFTLISAFLANSLDNTNIPNKEYWLKEENRKSAIYLLQNQMMWILNLTIILFDFIVAHVIFYNLNGANILPFWLVLIVYAVVLVIVIYFYYRKFKNKRFRYMEVK